MKKTSIVGSVVVLIIIGFLFINKGDENGSGILTEESTITRYQIGDGITDYAFLAFHFRKDTTHEWYAQGFVDANNDGEFSDEEWVIKNEPALVLKNIPNRFSFTLPDSLKTIDAPETVLVTIALSDRDIETADVLSKVNGHLNLRATLETITLEEEFGLNVPGASPELKRGVGLVQYAYAEGEASGVNGTNLPDLSGGPMDCFAIATANNLINMANQHGRRDDLPENPQELITALKEAMQWNNGILNRNFLTGKAQIIQDIGFPIETEEILRPTISQLRQALSNGDGVEISTTMLNSRSNRADTGHVFTGISATNQGVSVKDPATPNGTDTLGLFMTSGRTPYTGISYPMWDGIVVVDAIYIQRWREPAGEEKSSIAPPEEKTETKVGGEPIEMIKPTVEATFAHVKPGEYSEVYAVVTGLTPGTQTTARMFAEWSPNGAPQVVDADKNGVAHFTWRITVPGKYNINVTTTDGGYTGGATVVVE